MNPIIVTTIFSLISSGVLLSCIASTSKKIRKLKESYDEIIPVGTEKESTTCRKSVERGRIKLVKLKSGKYINSKDFIRIKICGNSMKPIGIKEGDEWLATPFKECKEDINTGDVVLLYLKDKNKYKIREVLSIGEGEVITCSYKNGKKLQSSKPHKLDMIKGKLKYSIE